MLTTPLVPVRYDVVHIWFALPLPHVQGWIRLLFLGDPFMRSKHLSGRASAACRDRGGMYMYTLLPGFLSSRHFHTCPEMFSELLRSCRSKNLVIDPPGIQIGDDMYWIPHPNKQGSLPIQFSRCLEQLAIAEWRSRCNCSYELMLVRKICR